MADYANYSIRDDNGDLEYGACVTEDGTEYDIHVHLVGTEDDPLAERLAFAADDFITLTLRRSTDELDLHMWSIVRVESSPTVKKVAAERAEPVATPLQPTVATAQDPTIKIVKLLVVIMDYPGTADAADPCCLLLSHCYHVCFLLLRPRPPRPLTRPYAHRLL